MKAENNRNKSHSNQTRFDNNQKQNKAIKLDLTLAGRRCI